MPRTPSATAQIAIGKIAKSLDQAIASLEELETEGKALNDSEAARVAFAGAAKWGVQRYLQSGCPQTEVIALTQR